MGYLLRLAFDSVKLFSFINIYRHSKHVVSVIINRYEVNLSPCSIPATMSKFVSQFAERTFTFVFLYSIIMASTVSFGGS